MAGGLGDAYEKLYKELPDKLLPSSTSSALGKFQEEQGSGLKDFLKGLIPKSDQKDIDSELKKTVALFKQKGSGGVNNLRRQMRKTRRKIKGTSQDGTSTDQKNNMLKVRAKKRLSAKQTRVLGLNKLPKTGILFSDMKETHRLWSQYFLKLLQGGGCSAGAEEQARMRVYRADLHGAYFKVTKSSVPSQVGLEGFVVLETRNTFQLVTPSDTLKTVPKKGASFTFRAGPDFVITIAGTQLCMKPSERATKKLKNRPPFDL